MKPFSEGDWIHRVSEIADCYFVDGPGLPGFINPGVFEVWTAYTVTPIKSNSKEGIVTVQKVCVDSGFQKTVHHREIFSKPSDG